MGNAKFFFYPEPHGSQAHLVELDIGEALGEMFSDVEVDAVDAVSINGSIQRSVGRMQEVVTIQRDRMLLGEDLAIRFYALQNHLDRGFSCAFTADHDKAYCFPLLGSHNAGTTKLKFYANPFVAFAGSSPQPAANDYMTVETSSPNMIQEMIKVQANNASSAGGDITLTNRLCFQYDKPAFARHYRFYPVLKRPQSDIGQAIITNEGGRLFSLSLRLIVDYETLYANHPLYTGESGTSLGQGLVRESPASGEIASGRSGGTLDGIPRRRRSGFGDIGLEEIDSPQIQGEFE